MEHIDTKDPQTVEQAIKILQADPSNYLSLSEEMRARVKERETAPGRVQ